MPAAAPRESMVDNAAHLAGCVLFIAIMVWAATSDLLTMRIGNGVVAVLALAFFPLSLLSGASAFSLAAPVLAGAAVFALGFAAFSVGVMGGGDGKLAAATALWLGFERLPAYLLATALIGGVLALAILAFRARPLPRVLQSRRWARRLHRRETGVPYGLALAPAGVIALHGTVWLPSAA